MSSVRARRLNLMMSFVFLRQSPDLSAGSAKRFARRQKDG